QRRQPGRYPGCGPEEDAQEEGQRGRGVVPAPVPNKSGAAQAAPFLFVERIKLASRSVQKYSRGVGLMAKKSKLAARAAELEAAVVGLFTGTPVGTPAPAKKKRAKAKKAKVVKATKKA